MRPHPRIRKMVKWGGAVLAAMFLVVWAASGRWGCTAVGESRMWGGMWRGEAYLGHWSDRPRERSLTVHTCAKPAFQYSSRLSWSSKGTEWTLIVPVWIAAAMTGGVALVAWTLDLFASIRVRAGRCPNCSYSRAGLPASAPCPECGSPASNTPPAAR